MSVSTKFQNFCSNLRIKSHVVDSISNRYKRITKQLNKDFWGTDSDTAHSLYVGSYGRDTDIHTSDIDVLMQLSWVTHQQYKNYIGNGQSALLQAVRDSLRNTYPTTHVKGDGQVVQINFNDGVSFEILPAFLYDTGRYSYPDTNYGGSWKTTDPKAEIKVIRDGNNLWNGNLKNLCRMARAWKEKWDVPIGGLLIDTLAYQFIKTWEHRNNSYVYYDWMTRDFFEFLKNQNSTQTYWLAPGSEQHVSRKGNFEYKATRCYNIAKEAIDYEVQEMPYSANSKWQEIYGSKF